MSKQQVKDLIKQTAIDYCMAEREVKRIFNQYPMDEFYGELENFIEERRHA